MNTLTIASKEIRLFNGLYSLNDLHKASGSLKKHQPALFARSEQTKELIQEIFQSTDSQTALETVNGGPNRGTYACKELVYAYAMWISAKFHLHVIRAFDKLVTEQVEALQPATITTSDQRLLQEKVAKLAHDNRAYAKYWGAIKTHFRIGSYKDLQPSQIDEAINVLEGVVIKEKPKKEEIEYTPLTSRRFLVWFDDDGKEQFKAIDPEAGINRVSDWAKMIAEPGGLMIDDVTVLEIMQACSDRFLRSEHWRKKKEAMQ